MKCEKRGVNMCLGRRARLADGRWWHCGKVLTSGRCEFSKSIRHNNFFTGSNLPIPVILQLVFEFFRGSSINNIHQDLGVAEHTMVNWWRYSADVLVDFIEENTEKIGGPGKIVKVDESKIGKQKYNHGHFVEGLWVFGGVEHELEHCFMVAVYDRTADAHLGLIEQWIEPGTLIMADSSLKKKVEKIFARPEKPCLATGLY